MDTVALRAYIADKRPSLSESSVNTYASILRSLHKGAFGTVDFDPESVDKTNNCSLGIVIETIEYKVNMIVPPATTFETRALENTLVMNRINLPCI